MNASIQSRHGPYLAGLKIETVRPLPRACIEFSHLVPGINPGESIVQTEEQASQLFAVLVLDLSPFTAVLKLRCQEIPMEDLGVGHAGGLFELHAFISVGGDQVPSSAWRVLIRAGKWLVPVLDASLQFPGAWRRWSEPFFRGHCRFKEDVRIWTHSLVNVDKVNYYSVGEIR